MSTHVLAQQVLERLSTTRLNRPQMLPQLAKQVEQFYNLEQAWQQQLASAKLAVARADEEIASRGEEMQVLQDSTREVEQEHKKKLATVCKEMFAEIDAHTRQQNQLGNELAQSQKRLVEQKAMVVQLEGHNKCLQSSLEKTIRKFDEVAASYVSEDSKSKVSSGAGSVGGGRGTTGSRSWTLGGAGGGARGSDDASAKAGPGAELGCALTRMQNLATECDRGQRDLTGLKSKLGQLQDDLAAERTHALRLEEFVRRVALGPSASVRTGGGYVLDDTAKREAHALMHEMASLSQAVQAVPGAANSVVCGGTAGIINGAVGAAGFHPVYVS